MIDQNRKTMRTFYCRDYLWDLFEAMAGDMGCSTDYLINEAMRHYARSKNYASHPEPPAMAPVQAPKPALSPRRSQAAAPVPARRPAPIPQPVPEPQPAYYPPPVERRPRLTLIFNGMRYPVDKDRFIIGRGTKTSDLTIKDGNVSRQHAVVVFQNGAFYIKDLGSTNGIDYSGMRIDNKRVEEGDVFYICDYALQFTYR